MSDEMGDEMSAVARSGSVEREVYRSASALTLGVCLFLGGMVALLLGGVLFAMGVGHGFGLVAFLAIATIIAGIVQLAIGVYQCADNIDRAAKVLIDGQRG
jgi:preprotein translocase subunit SecY